MLTSREGRERGVEAYRTPFSQPVMRARMGAPAAATSREWILRVGPAQTTVRRVAQVDSLHSLGDRHLDVAVLPIALFERLNRLANMSRYEGPHSSREMSRSAYVPFAACVSCT